MSRNSSLLILSGTAIVIGVLYFRVVQPFIVPMFFAAVLAVLFRPVYVWLRERSFGHHRMAAAFLTMGVLMVIMLPLGAALTLAGIQLVEAGRDLVAVIDLPDDAREAIQWLDKDQVPELGGARDYIARQLADVDTAQLRKTSANSLLRATEGIYDRTRALAADVISFMIGLAVMIVALYYFFADGEKLLNEARQLVPLAREDQEALLLQFDNICRGVVLGTVVAGLAQGILAGIGFALVGVERIWLLAVCSMMFSFIPFLGAAVVWVCVTVVLLFGQRYGAAGFLAVYGTLVISGSDNIIKAQVLHGRAQMHPLIAFVSVLGGLQLVGLWGIFLGPITAAFFYAMLKILNKKLLERPSETDESPQSVGEAA